ncbi:hypothetical protein BDQ17DRAFT_1439679 [Cyathus striatus]|nr:hypothetical protein BDQ17DRAFT_1439679 [Cyathus striatus]
MAEKADASGEELHSTSMHNAALIGAIGGVIMSAIITGPLSWTFILLGYEPSWLKVTLIWSLLSYPLNITAVAIGAAIVKEVMLDSIGLKDTVADASIGVTYIHENVTLRNITPAAFPLKNIGFLDHDLIMMFARSLNQDTQLTI